MQLWPGMPSRLFLLSVALPLLVMGSYNLIDEAPACEVIFFFPDTFRWSHSFYITCRVETLTFVVPSVRPGLTIQHSSVPIVGSRQARNGR